MRNHASYELAVPDVGDRIDVRENACASARLRGRHRSHTAPDVALRVALRNRAREQVGAPSEVTSEEGIRYVLVPPPWVGGPEALIDVFIGQPVRRLLGRVSRLQRWDSGRKRQPLAGSAKR